MLPSLLRIRPFLRRRWTLPAPRTARVSGRWRASVEVAGQPVWFESADVPLAASPEAFAGLCLIPALHFGATVHVEPSLDPHWLAQTAQLPPVFARWWGYPERYPLCAAPSEHPNREPAGRAAQCFSGGVDSFYSLLCGNFHADYLVLIHGFDIALDDRQRMAAAERSVHGVADATGRRLIVLRTNLREHRLLRRVSWERLHGAALAAAGHLLSGLVGRLVIPPSWTYEHPVPWGSNWQTDRFWSSSALDVVHDNATHRRPEKVRAVAHHPLVREHLRVCWKNLSPTGNCSRCEKCVRTMVALAGCGGLERSRVFDLKTPLAERIRALGRVPDHMRPGWRYLLESDLAPDVNAAIDDVIAAPPPSGGLRRLFRAARGR